MPRYIDADALTLKIDDWRVDLEETYGKNDEYVQCLESVLGIIDDAPTADVVEIKHGKWVEKWNGHFKSCMPRCSLCSSASPFKYNYCPTCGADMGRKEDVEIY